MSVLPISVPTKRLASAITSSALSFSTNNIKDWAGNNLTSAMFGTLAYVVFRNSTNTLMEVVEIDATTIAAASITITKRGLDFVGGTTSVAANQLAWPANDTLVDFGSDPAQLLTQGYMSRHTSETIPSGVVKTFITSPVVPTGGTGTQAANATDIANAVTGASGTATNLVNGTLKLSVAAASAPSPIAVGDNDPRMTPNNTDIAFGSGNKPVSQTGLQHSAENYATSTTGNDTYVVTLSPVPTSYTAGMTIRFKPDTANTGAATLNVNGLGAKSILRNDASALVDGDIAANAVIQVVYDGTQFLLQSPYSALPKYTSGTSSKNASDASTTQNIAHGLGRIPKYIKIHAVAVLSATSPANAFAIATYNGTTQSSLSVYETGTSSYQALPNFVLNMATGGGQTQSGVVTFDSTNIIITWTKAGSPTGSYTIIWEAFA